VNVRGPKEMGSVLSEIGAEAIAYLMGKMKDRENPMAAAEAMVLEQVFRGEPPKGEFFPGIDYARLLYEMEVKQKLVASKGDALTLTILGRKLVE